MILRWDRFNYVMMCNLGLHMFSDLYVTCIPWKSTLSCFIARFFRSATIFQQRTCFIIQKETPWSSMVVDFQLLPRWDSNSKSRSDRNHWGVMYFSPDASPKKYWYWFYFCSSYLSFFFEMLQFLPEHLFQTLKKHHLLPWGNLKLTNFFDFCCFCFVCDHSKNNFLDIQGRPLR